jgi:hypothetical protein
VKAPFKFRYERKSVEAANDLVCVSGSGSPHLSLEFNFAQNGKDSEVQ